MRHRNTITGRYMYSHRPLVSLRYVYPDSRPIADGRCESARAAVPLFLAFVALFGRIAECAAVCRRIETTRYRRCQVVCIVARTRPPSLPVRLNEPGPVQYSVPERKTSTRSQGQTLIVVADKPLCISLADTYQVATKKENRVTCFRPNHIPSRKAHQSLCGINKKRTTR